jgi:tetratricopeptide (TPR) repeat protein
LELEIANRRFNEAAEGLRELVTLEENADAYLLLAQAEFGRGSVHASQAALDRSVELQTEPSIPLMRLQLKIALRTEDWNLALKVYRTLTELRITLHLMEQVGRIEAFYHFDMEDRGRTLLESLLKAFEPTPPPALVIEYARWEGRREPARTRTLVKEVFERYPVNANLLELMIRYDIADGHSERALPRVEHALALLPDDPKLQLTQGRLLIHLRRWAEGEASVLRALELDPKVNGGMDQLLVLYKAQDKPQKAIDFLKGEQEAARLDEAGQLQLASLYFEQEEFAEAEKMYELVLEGDPNSVRGNREYALLLASQGTDLERALTLAKRAQEGAGASWEVAHTLGFVYLRKGMNEAAEQQIRYAIELAQRSGVSSVAYHFHLAQALRGQGRDEEADQEMEKASALLLDSRRQAGEGAGATDRVERAE